MADSGSTKPVVADQNLLFGVLALQAGLVDTVQFADACSAWATRVDVPLAEVLVGRGWLTGDDRAEVDRLLERKLRKQAGSQPGGSRSTPSPLSAAALTATNPYLQALLPSGYERKSLHATGGMGQIWRSYDPNLDREIAIKELRPDLAGDYQIRERFLREARITGQLAHPGIVPIHCLGQNDRGAYYYVMRFVNGRTLDEVIAAYHRQPDPLVFREVLRHFGDVCQTVAFAHSRNVIHRDLKPQNIMLGDFGETLVLDWGLAKRVEAGAGATPAPVSDPGLTQVGQLLGTPAYMAPEQVSGHTGGPLTDIYALGIILYEILTGKCPYEGPDSLAVLLQVRTGRMKPPSELRGDIPRGLETICLKATAAAPGERYQTAATLARAVEDWLADELARSEAALRESEEQVRLLLDSTAEAIYGADLNGNCIFCNPACVRMLGYQNPRDLLGKHMHSLMHHHRADGSAYPVEECHIYQAFREGRGTHIIDEVYWRSDGTPFPVEYWSYPVRREGQLIGCVISFLDITERITRERELILATQTANQACRAASADLEKLQRQLRVSLGEMVATTARLHDTELSAEQRGYLEGVTTSLQGLLALTAPHAGGQEDVL